MVYYITSSTNINIIKDICELRDWALEVNTNVEDIQSFVNAEIKNMLHVKYFVIDVSALKNNITEIIQAIESLKMLTIARIIIVALGYSSSDSVYQELLKSGVYNIITNKDKREAQREAELCLSTSGKPKEEPINIPTQIAEKNKDIEFIHRSPEVLNQPFVPAFTQSTISQKTDLTQSVSIKSSISIGVCGTERHVGATHHAIALTAYLTRAGYRACYIEANVHGDIQKMLEVYDEADSADESGAVNWYGVTLYSNFYFADIAKLDYDFYVYDYGTCGETSSQNYLTKDIKLLISGAKAWEYKTYNEIVPQIINVSNLFTIMNFSVPADQDQLPYKGLEQNTHFASYAPCCFEDCSNDGIYEKIIKPFLIKTEQKPLSKSSNGKLLKLFRR